MNVKRPRSAAHVALAAIVLTGGAVSLAACTPTPCQRNWTGATDSDFGTASNWAENAVPTASDRVCAPSGSSITVNGSYTVESAVLDGNVTIPAGSSLANMSAAGTVSAIYNLSLQGTLDGDAPMLLGEAQVQNATFSGSSFVALVGTRSTTIFNITVNGTKAVTLGDQTSWAGGAHLCDSATIAVVGNVSNNGIQLDSAGCTTVTNPRFGIAETGTFEVNEAGLEAPTIDVTNAGTLTLGFLATLRAKSLTQISGSTDMTTSTIEIPGGTFDLQAGTLQGRTGRIKANLTAAGTVVLDGYANRQLIVYGDFEATAGSTIRDTFTNGNGPWEGGTVRVLGRATLGGTLDVTADVGFAPDPDFSSTIVNDTNAGEPPVITGTFSTVNLPTVPGRTPALSYNDTTVDLVIP